MPLNPKSQAKLGAMERRLLVELEPTTDHKKLKNAILTILYEEPAKTVNYKQISTWLGIKDIETRKLVNVVLQELHDDDYLEQISRSNRCDIYLIIRSTQPQKK